MLRSSVQALDAELSRRSLAQFVGQAWPILEPETELVWGWHLDAICDHLEAVSDGRIRRLLINIPPGHMKSLLVAVFWPAWVWLKRPGWRVLFGSYAGELSLRDSVRCRDVVESLWYRETFRPGWQLKTDQNVKTWFETTRGGMRMALAVGGKGTGFRGDCIVFDDPMNVEEWPTDTALAKVPSWWDKRMSSRLNDLRVGARVGIMQRLHEKDLTGHLLKRGGYTHLCLPTEYDPDEPCKTAIGFKDPRRKRGELLFPGLFPPEVVDEAKEDLGDYAFAAQHNQRAAPPGGGIIQRKWFRFWYPQDLAQPPVPHVTILEDGTSFEHEQAELPGDLSSYVQSWDMTFKGRGTGGTKSRRLDRDFVAGQIWGSNGKRRFLIEQALGRWTFTQAVEQVEVMSAAYPEAEMKLVEDAANGPAIMDQLEDTIGGFEPVPPRGSKLARTHAASHTIRAGYIYLPHPDLFPWVEHLLYEVCVFPNGKHDDQLDGLTQAINWLRESEWGLV